MYSASSYCMYLYTCNPLYLYFYLRLYLSVLLFFLSAFVSLRFCVLFIVPTHVYLLLSLFVFPACSHTAHLHDSLHLPPSLPPPLSRSLSLCVWAKERSHNTFGGFGLRGVPLSLDIIILKNFYSFITGTDAFGRFDLRTPLNTPMCMRVRACACVGVLISQFDFFLSLPHFVYLFIPLLSISLSVMMFVHSQQ